MDQVTQGSDRIAVPVGVQGKGCSTERRGLVVKY